MSNLRLVTEDYDPSNTAHIEAAMSISSWQDVDKQSPDYVQMFDLDPEIIASHVFGTVGFAEDLDGTRTPAGYNGATAIHDNGMIETGGLIVNPIYRGTGLRFGSIIKHAMLTRLKELYPETPLITFANKKSQKINRAAGFRDAQREEIPKSALELCKNCIDYEEKVRICGQICCDEILILDPETPVNVN